jgi:hypothetical protein
MLSFAEWPYALETFQEYEGVGLSDKLLLTVAFAMLRSISLQ